MSIKTIITEPNKLLRQVSKPVEKVGKEEQKIMNNMLDTMYDANAVSYTHLTLPTKRIV